MDPLGHLLVPYGPFRAPPGAPMHVCWLGDPRAHARWSVGRVRAGRDGGGGRGRGERDAADVHVLAGPAARAAGAAAARRVTRRR